MTVKSLSAQKSGKKGTHGYRNLSYRETGNILLFYQKDLYIKTFFDKKTSYTVISVRQL